MRAADRRTSDGRVRMYTDGSMARRAGLRARGAAPGDSASPAPRSSPSSNATTVIEPGWRAALTRADHLVLERVVPRAARARDRHDAPIPCCSRCSTTCSWRSPSRWACTLANTAYSVNIKERLDFSCALFDARGQPDRQRAAHAGAPGLDGRERARRSSRRRAGTMRPGDVFVLNAPVQRRHAPARRHGGRCRCSRDGARRDVRCSIVAARGHHADIGGITPGSMPPTRTRRRGGRAARQRAARRARALPRSRDARAALGAGAIRRATSSRTSPTCARRSRPARRARDELAKMVAHFGLAGRARVHAARAGQRRGGGAPRRSACCTTARFEYEMDNGAVIRVAIASIARDAQRDDRLHRHERAAADATSTRRPRCARRRCCTCSARSSTTRSR